MKACFFRPATVLLLMILFNNQVHATEADVPDITGSVVFFYYDDIEQAATFYSGLLELEITMDTEWVKIFQITPTSSVGLVKNGRGFHQVAEDKPSMLSMVTDDVDAWYERLQSAGTVILKALPPHTAPESGDAAPIRGFIARDPGGYTVEFFSWNKSP